ncbi:hypothetical protein KPH14_001411 [Odynerus spinipes]|uniref:LIM zinc-binding domain-containing protein n=1 Tax=Odynerus spinipes TaxID=1348599 RepID=A0AAD9RUY1_9HYME|nr:hypothetical protein KPH14_001411 [Odynerus spinipes]
MAEVATKKSISVVSNKKNEVCGVQSNNGLIDLDNIAASNNQLISLCDTNDDEDDLVLTNNTRNELGTEDKSLQELIESELALRICSSNEEEEEEDSVAEKEDIEETSTQPEAVKRIVLDRQEDPFRVNADFIVAEVEHCALIEEPYGYQNGHVSPETNVKPDPPETIDFRDEKKEEEIDEERVFDEQVQEDAVVVQKSIGDEVDRVEAADNENDLFLRPDQLEDRVTEVKNFGDVKLESEEIIGAERESYQVEAMLSSDVKSSPVACPDKYQQEEESVQTKSLIETETELIEIEAEDREKKNNDLVDTWTDQVPDAQQIGEQFSDNFDEAVEDAAPISNKELAAIEHSEKDVDDDRLGSKNTEYFQIAKSPAESNHTIELTSPEIGNKIETIQESPQDVSSTQSRSFDDVTPSQSEASTDAASTQEFIDMERRVLNEESSERNLEEIKLVPDSTESPEKNGMPLLSQQASNEIVETLENEQARSKSTILVEKTEVLVSDTNVTIFSETKRVETLDASEMSHPRKFDSWMTVEEATRVEEVREEDEKSMLQNERVQDGVAIEREDTNETIKTDSDRSTQDDELASSPRAPLATPDDETSDIINVCDSETREEKITTSTTTTTVSGSSKSAGTKTKKKKIEGVAGNDASSPNLTPRTKKTKKSKKSDLEKENISVKSSFNKFDALSKKTVLHVRSVDAGKVQQQLNAVGQNGDANQNCRSCGKVVFQMEQTKAEGLVWHKNCFRCVQCSKPLNVDNYESHESTLYCKPHFKELFQPKPVEESDQPVRPRKPELIIRENEPKELPPDVVRASDKPDLGLEELSSLNVKSRFQVFEKAGTENTNEIERSPSQIAVKRSPSILSKLAKFQAKGMDIGVADESLNGIPYEESSESEEEDAAEDVEEVDTEIIKAKRTTRERPISFSKMDDIKNRWESTSQQGRREVQREARKEEIAGIRSRLFMGKQGKMKEMYQQAVAGSERVTKINAAEEIQHSTHARSIKERFERGEPIATSDDETDSKPKPEKADEEVIAAGISRKSRSLFLELDATAAKTGRPVTPVNPKTPADAPRRARDAFMGRQVSEDVVRSSDTTEDVHAETSDISNKFKFFESYKEPEKQRKQFRITPPRDGQVKMDSPEREIYRDPEVVRADDRVDEMVHTDTARKMLSIFRQMEENACKEELPEGPKPLKRFTPPPEDKFAKPTASDSEEDEEEEGEESEAEESAEERDPNYVRASDKVEDEFLKQAQNAARAKTLRAKFEHWEETDGKPSNHNIAEMEIAQSTGDQSSIESASSLRARFESLGSQTTTESPRAPKIKVNRFVEIQAGCADVCESCEKKVYPLEKVETNNKIFHKQCFRCLQCNCVLRMDTFTLNNGKLYCIPHFKQLFITRGNYDEGFGVDPHKNKWATSNANSANVSPIAVSNGDL